MAKAEQIAQARITCEEKGALANLLVEELNRWREFQAINDIVHYDLQRGDLSSMINDFQRIMEMMQFELERQIAYFLKYLWEQRW